MTSELNTQLSFSDFGKAAEKKYEQFRNLDPFPDIKPALLNSADIADYVAETGMICPFNPQRLGPASYEMVLGGEYLYWNDGGGRVSKTSLKNEEELILRKNSITYVSVRETFRIPNYIALRFNLRVRHVHRGLLLGTGPLIDPGFQGNLMIPIHNLTNNDYIIAEGEDLISVEFTKVSPNKEWKIKEGLESRQQGEYVENSMSNSRKTFEKLLKKVLPIGIGKVESSLSDTLANANNKIETFGRYQKYSAIAAVMGVMTLIAMFFTTFSVISDANKYVSDASMLIKKHKQDDFDVRNFVVRDEVDELKVEVERLKEELNRRPTNCY